MLVCPDFVEKGWVTIEQVIFQNDPFFSECRAYGRLKDAQSEHLAARCYGYVLLTAAQEAELDDRGCATSWDRRDATRGRPIRGIVKEYIPDGGGPPFTFDMLPRMKRDVRDLNALGIINWDIREDNYRCGRLVDFSQARTSPHMELDLHSALVPRNVVAECCVRDQACFDDMVQLWNEEHPAQRFWGYFLPDPVFGRRLRDRSRYRLSLKKSEGASLAAALYDWRPRARRPESRTTGEGAKGQRKRGRRATTPSKLSKRMRRSK